MFFPRRARWAGVAVAALGCPLASADEVLLTDRGSSARFNTGTQAGLFDWVVDGVDNMGSSWVWFRIGPVGGEASIDTLNQTNLIVDDRDADPGNEFLSVEYTSPDRFAMTLEYSLVGEVPGSGVSLMLGTTRIENIGDRALDFHLFQYYDYNLAGEANDRLVRIVGRNGVAQEDGPGELAQWSVAPVFPSRVEVDFVPAILNSLNDGQPTSLSGARGPIGPGDLSAAFEFEFALGVNESILLANPSLVTIPEPHVSILLIGLVLGLLARRSHS